MSIARKQNQHPSQMNKVSIMRKFVILLILISLASCQSKNSHEQIISGMALGTDYHIKFFSKQDFEVHQGIDSIFKAVNKSMSNYQEDSDISKINAGDSSIIVDAMFRDVFLLSKKIYHKTDGYFDPTVGNLVNAYGFGAQKKNLKLNSETIDSLMKYVGFDMVSLTDNNKIIKKYPEIYIDFNAIGKGYAVDRLGIYLENKGVQNYLVEVGGEIRAKGKNLDTNKTWRLGIDDPDEIKNGEQIMGVMKLKNKSLATSGNYRKFRYDSITGKKYVHIINPKMGYMEQRNILSASVIAKNCATADAYATTFMAMGLEKAEKLAKELKNIDVYFIYDDHGAMKTYRSKGFANVMENQ